MSTENIMKTAPLQGTGDVNSNPTLSYINLQAQLQTQDIQTRCPPIQDLVSENGQWQRCRKKKIQEQDDWREICYLIYSAIFQCLEGQGLPEAETVSSPLCLLACDGLPLINLMKFSQVAISSLGWRSHGHHVWCRNTLCWQTFIWTRANIIITPHVNLDLVLDTPLQIKVPPLLLKMFQS